MYIYVKLHAVPMRHPRKSECFWF